MSYSSMQFVAECLTDLGVAQKVAMTGEIIRDIGDLEHNGFIWNGADQVLEGIQGAPFELSYKYEQAEDMYWFYRWPRMPIEGPTRAYVSPDRRSQYEFDGTFYQRKVSV